jgi:hypothetical protein
MHAQPLEPIQADRERFCSDKLLSKDALCRCLAEPEVTELSCKHEPVGAGFGTFTRTNGDTLAVHEREGGMIVVGFLFGMGYESNSVTASRVPAGSPARRAA